MIPPTFQDILLAAERLAGVAHRTPVMRSTTLDKLAGAEVFLKCESFQRMGAFKFRGAYNAMSQLLPEERARGVVTHSSGNHAQAVALAGSLLGIRTTIVMPKDAPAIKRKATEGYGAKVLDYDPQTDTRERISQELVEKEGFILVPPYDHPHIVAGAGTAALELCQEVCLSPPPAPEEEGSGVEVKGLATSGPLDYVFAPCGGGGLLSGTAIASRGMNPSVNVIGVEPELADDAARSFASGQIQTVKNPPTIADGCRTPSLSPLTFQIIRENVHAFATVSERAITDAVRFLFERMKLVVEPSGALGVAALFSGAIRVEGRVGVILSGGNVDGAAMAKILRGEI